MAPTPPVPRDDSFARRLLRRWFVEFNPLYLVSAALVCAGCFLWSRGLARGDEGDVALLAITAVSEAYAIALALGAALLVRIGYRRPATMLALLFVLYQWDLTLHTETCAMLGFAGACRSAAWLALFGAKVRLLAWALRVRVERRVAAAWALGAIGLALGPHVVPALGGRAAGSLVAAWAFALGALYRRGGVTSRAPLDAWGETVLARATRAAWALSGALLFAHVLFWASDHALDLAPLVVAPPLVAARAVRREARMALLVGGTLAFTAVVIPSAFAIASLLACATLVPRAFAPAFDAEADATSIAPSIEPPYRASAPAAVAPAIAVPPPPIAAVIGAAESARSFTAALVAFHLALWTTNWTGGAWPAHVLALDLALAIALVALATRLHARVAYAPLAANAAHFVWQAHLIPPPRTAAQWGGVAIALGFALLGASLLASYRLRYARCRPCPTPPSTAP